jgi:hypothetical protein
LQGALIRKFRDVVLGHKHISTLNDDDEESSSQKRVGNAISKGNVKRSQRSDNVKRYDDGPSVEKKRMPVRVMLHPKCSISVGNDISKGNVKRSQRSDNVKRYDDGPSVEKKEDGQLSYGENHQLSYADVTRGRK